MKKRLMDELLEEVTIEGDRQIHVKLRADIINLMQNNKDA
jgi:hypothetical protein